MATTIAPTNGNFRPFACHPTASYSVSPTAGQSRWSSDAGARAGKYAILSKPTTMPPGAGGQVVGLGTSRAVVRAPADPSFACSDRPHDMTIIAVTVKQKHVGAENAGVAAAAARITCFRFDRQREAIGIIRLVYCSSRIIVKRIRMSSVAFQS